MVCGAHLAERLTEHILDLLEEGAACTMPRMPPPSSERTVQSPAAEQRGPAAAGARLRAPAYAAASPSASSPPAPPAPSPRRRSPTASRWQLPARGGSRG
eukprot:6346237-Prymnesium_polylepis.3